MRQKPFIHSSAGIFSVRNTRAVAMTLSTLAEPNRLQIVELLREGPLPVGKIVGLLGLRQPQVSKHLHVLSDAGLVEMHPVAQQRVYGLRGQPLQELEDWVESYSHFWKRRLDRLDDLLTEMQKEERKSQGGRKHASK
jgi:DNA-binding transcriptional ArsR family regulator